MLDRTTVGAADNIAPDCDHLDESASAPTPGARAPLTYREALDATAAAVGPITKAPRGNRAKPSQLSGAERPAQRNARSALRRFMAYLGKVDTDLVGEELAEGFLVALERFSAWEREQGTPGSTLSSRRSLLRNAKEAVARLTDGPASTTFASGVTWALKRDPRHAKEIAALVGVCELTLSNWRRGTATPGRRRHQVAQLEQVLGLKAGFLLERLPARASKSASYGNELVVRPTKFRRQLRRVVREARYTVQDIPASLKADWRALLVHKTAANPPLKRDPKGVWRAKEATLCKPMSSPWCCYLDDGRVCVSASAAWANVRQYLSFLTLPMDRGGLAMPVEDAMTLGHLTDVSFVQAFIKWRENRVGHLNTGATTFVHTVASLIHPVTGWIAQSPWLGQQLPMPIESGDWLRHCEHAFKALRAYGKTLASAAKPTRDVTEPIQSVLDESDPIATLFGMLDAMEADMPSVSQPQLRAIHQRDIALVGLLLANPLRIGQLTAFDFGSGSDRNLRREETAWRMVSSGERYKNGKSTMVMGLDADLPSWLTPLLDRYVREGRRVLLGDKESRYFFVGRAPWSPETVCANLESRLQILTARYLANCPGFRGHGWRHVIAHAWLREHPQDFLTVANLLGDTVETVIKKYGHIKHADAVKSYGAWAEPSRTKRKP